MHVNYSGRRYAMLEIRVQAFGYRRGKEVMTPRRISYRCIEQFPQRHPGCDAVRTLLETFYIYGREDKHQCLVHTPL